MGSNREKSNIAIAILEKLPFLNGNKNYWSLNKDQGSFLDFFGGEGGKVIFQWAYKKEYLVLSENINTTI